MPYKYRDQWHVKMRSLKKKQTLKHRSEGTIESYMMILEQIWHMLGEPIDPLGVPLETYQTLENIMKAEDYMDNTIVLYMTVLRVFLKFSGYPDLEEIYVLTRALPKENRVFLEEEQIAAAREVAHKLGARYELSYSLAVDNSLRRADISNITLDEALSLVSKGEAYIMQKGKRKRLLILHRNTLDPLKAYLKEREEGLKKSGVTADPFLFVHFQSGKHVGPSAVYYWIIKISDAAGFYFRPHDLRATFVRRHSRAGTRPETVMNLAGHKSWGTTFRHYYGEDQREMKNAQNKI